MVTTEQSERLIGATVVDPTRARIGEVRQVFLDAASDEPAWVGVRVGLFGAEVLVPLEGADWDERSLRAAVSRSCVRSAPEVDLDEPLSTAQHERVCRHYGIPSVRSPRESIDWAAFEDGAVSYSVKDVAMVDDDRSDAPSADTSSQQEPDLGTAMRDAEHEHREGVSGHMLQPAPTPLDDAAR